MDEGADIRNKERWRDQESIQTKLFYGDLKYQWTIRVEIFDMYLHRRVWDSEKKIVLKLNIWKSLMRLGIIHSPKVCQVRNKSKKIEDGTQQLLFLYSFFCRLFYNNYFLKLWRIPTFWHIWGRETFIASLSPLSLLSLSLLPSLSLCLSVSPSLLFYSHWVDRVHCTQESHLERQELELHFALSFPI